MRFASSNGQELRFIREIEGKHLPQLSAGLGQFALPDEQIVRATNRLQGRTGHLALAVAPPASAAQDQPAVVLSLELNRQCSWPPEDSKIESFHTHVRDQAKAIIGADLAKSEKSLRPSMKDGIDIRESLRHWHQRAKPGARTGWNSTSKKFLRHAGMSIP